MKIRLSPEEQKNAERLHLSLRRAKTQGVVGA
jgi:hypothetical protein